MLGRPPVLEERSHLLAIPMCVRPKWMLHVVMDRFNAFLHALASWGLFHARECMAVCAMLDWSPFSDAAPRPVAEYSWLHAPPRHVVTLHESVIHECLVRKVRKRLPCVHVALHAVMRWHNHSFVCPKPLHRTEHVLYPHFCV